PSFIIHHSPFTIYHLSFTINLVIADSDPQSLAKHCTADVEIAARGRNDVYADYHHLSLTIHH
ncbi:MAG: hypothetical protein SNG02_07820, partial [Rikenellaceae bacterium]